MHRRPPLGKNRRHSGDARARSTVESLGVSRIDHIFRVHRHAILEEESAAKTFDEVGLGSLERLFPGFTEDCAQQVALSAGQPGIGFKGSVDVARPAHLGTVIAARPRIRDVIRDTTKA